MKDETLLPNDLIHMAISAIDDLLDHCDPSTDQYCCVWADVPDKLRAAIQSGNSVQPVTVPADWITDEVINAAYEKHLYGIMSGTGNKRAAIDFLNECMAGIAKTAKGDL